MAAGLSSADIERAVSVFYSSEHSDRAEAHKWLTEAQRCPQAWTFVWDLLHADKTTEIQFFAATTLHTKLQRCWAELPPDSYAELKQRIIQAIGASFNGPKIVVNRLCISLAAFILQQRAVGLLETVAQLSDLQDVSLVIEVLSVVPEEFNNMTMALSDRTAVRVNLQRMTVGVLELVMKHLQNNFEGKQVTEDHWNYQINIWQGACQCAGAWIQLGGVNPTQCSPIVNAALQILHLVYSFIDPRGHRNSDGAGRSELGHAELETCEAALNVAAATLTQPDAGRYPSTCCLVLRSLLNAVQPVLQIEDVLHGANQDLVQALYGTLVSAGEFHSRWIAVSVSESEACYNCFSHMDEQIDRSESSRCAKDMLKLLLCCSGAAGVYPTQETHSRIAFSFWFTLQDEGLWNSREGSAGAMKQGLRVWYEELVVILLRKSTISSQHSEFSAEDDELIRCYRQDIADTLVYCHTVLGNPLVVQLELLMRNLTENCLSDGGCALEAVLHAFLALAEFIHPSAAPSLLTLMRVLTELPYDKLYQQILLTALACFIAYADWLGKLDSPGVEEIVGKALNIIWATMDNKELSSLGVLALKAICKECSKYLQPHAHQLLQVFQSGQGKWPHLIASQIMRAAGCTAASLPAAEAAPYLTNLVSPLVTKLQIAKKKDLNAKQLLLCTNVLQQASALMLSLLEAEIKHAVVPLTLLLPTFADIAAHPKLTEPLFKLIKLIITRLQEECMPLMADLIHVTNISLSINPHPTNIEVCKVSSLMLPELGGDAFTAAVSAVLRASEEAINQGQTLSVHAPLIDSFFSALSTMLNKKPQTFQSFESQVEHIVQLALMAISLPEQGPSRSICHFFGNFARVHPNKLLPHGPVLVHRIVHCIGGLISRNYIDPFADLLWKLGHTNWVNLSNNDVVLVQSPTHISNWLKEALQEPGFPTEMATNQVKDKFLKAVVKYFAHKRRLMEAVREFSLASRGLLNTYGESTQPIEGGTVNAVFSAPKY